MFLDNSNVVLWNIILLRRCFGLYSFNNNGGDIYETGIYFGKNDV